MTTFQYDTTELDLFQRQTQALEAQAASLSQLVSKQEAILQELITLNQREADRNTELSALNQNETTRNTELSTLNQNEVARNAEWIRLNSMASDRDQGIYMNPNMIENRHKGSETAGQAAFDVSMEEAGKVDQVRERVRNPIKWEDT